MKYIVNTLVCQLLVVSITNISLILFLRALLTGRQIFSLDNRNLNFFPAGAYKSVQCKQNAWTKEEVVEEGVLHQSASSMYEHQYVQNHVQFMCPPEPGEHVPTGVLYGECVY